MKIHSNPILGWGPCTIRVYVFRFHAHDNFKMKGGYRFKTLSRNGISSWCSSPLTNYFYTLHNLKINRDFLRLLKMWQFWDVFCLYLLGKCCIFCENCVQSQLLDALHPYKKWISGDYEKLDILNFRYFLSDFKISSDLRRFWYGLIICLTFRTLYWLQSFDAHKILV